MLSYLRSSSGTSLCTAPRCFLKMRKELRGLPQQYSKERARPSGREWPQRRKRAEQFCYCFSFLFFSFRQIIIAVKYTIKFTILTSFKCTVQQYPAHPQCWTMPMTIPHPPTKPSHHPKQKPCTHHNSPTAITPLQPPLHLPSP